MRCRHSPPTWLPRWGSRSRPSPRRKGRRVRMSIVIIDGDSLTLEQARVVAHEGAEVGVAPAARRRIDEARAYVERIIAEQRVVYGITTGFGKFSDVTIAGSDVLELQRNLILSHCCGVGESLDAEKTRSLMLLRANVLAKGYSGARYIVLQTLVEMLNRGLLPVIPSRGSVCLLYTSPSPRDRTRSRMPSS